MKRNVVSIAESREFSLRAFSIEAAAMSKYLIRARELTDPKFLGSDETYAQWKLDNIGSDRNDVTTLLNLASNSLGRIWEHMLDMGGSGGVPFGDPLADFKFSVCGLIDRHNLSQLLAGNISPGDGHWISLVDWSLLPRIRQYLDQLVTLMEKQFADGQEPQLLQASPSGRVLLFRQKDDPVAIVDGASVPKLTSEQHKVLSVLLICGKAGLPKAALQEKSACGAAVDILKRLKSKPPWTDVIYLPGNNRDGYKIL